MTGSSRRASLASTGAGGWLPASGGYGRRVDERGAVMGVARDICQAILEGSVTPYDGARRIGDLTLQIDEHLAALDTFVYAASEWDERPQDGNIFADGVVAAAKDIVTKHARD